MAAYTDLYSVSRDGTGNVLNKQILVAITIKANIISALATPTTAQRAFAVAALKDPTVYLQTLMNYILANYNTSTIAIILAATDAQVQIAVNAAVDTLLSL